MSIQYQCQDSNLRPHKHESSPITTRPGLIVIKIILSQPQAKPLLIKWKRDILSAHICTALQLHKNEIIFQIFPGYFTSENPQAYGGRYQKRKQLLDYKIWIEQYGLFESERYTFLQILIPRVQIITKSQLLH